MALGGLAVLLGIWPDTDRKAATHRTGRAGAEIRVSAVTLAVARARWARSGGLQSAREFDDLVQELVDQYALACA